MYIYSYMDRKLQQNTQCDLISVSVDLLTTSCVFIIKTYGYGYHGNLVHNEAHNIGQL